MNQFCDGYSESALGGSVGMSIEESIDKNVMIRIDEELSAKLESQPEDDRSDFFTRLVLSVRVPEEIDTLSNLNFSLRPRDGRQIWKLGYDVQKNAFPKRIL